MKQFVVPFLMCLLFAGAVNAQKKDVAGKAHAKKTQKKPAETATPSLAIGSPIPNADAVFQATNSKGVSLMQAKTEKGLLVMFSCNTCPYVIKAQKRTQEVLQYCKEQGIGAVIFNSNEGQRNGDDSFEEMMKYGVSQHYLYPYLKDDGSQMANFFGATRTPEVFLFDDKGTLVYKGAMEDNPAEPAKSQQLYLLQAIRAMMRGVTPNVAETKSIGCSIKR